jgi:3-oxoacyl-[acyl-carrier protein] reductase
LPAAEGIWSIFMSSKKRVALVTGASKGIGEAIFTLFNQKEIQAIGISRHIPLTETTLRCDVTKETEVRDLVDELVHSFGRIDILVNNAGIVSHKDIFEMSLDEWHDILDTNLTGAFLCSKYVLKYMIKNRYGKIINISSIAGRFRSQVASAAYTASKYGIIGLSRQLAFHYAKYNININVVSPSQTETSMLMDSISDQKLKEIVSHIPAERLARPKDVAEVVYFLSMDESSYINGAVIDVNGAQF